MIIIHKIGNAEKKTGFWGKMMYYFGRVQVKVTNGIATVETFTLKLNICV